MQGASFQRAGRHEFLVSGVFPFVEVFTLSYAKGDLEAKGGCCQLTTMGTLVFYHVSRDGHFGFLDSGYAGMYNH